MRVAASVVPPRFPATQTKLARAELPLLASVCTRAPLRHTLARIAARFVATRAWERLGFARLADYARERAGLSARQIQDLAQTRARLKALPQVEAALAAGRLGWSQARLVARVARPEDEARWIAFACSVRVRELEHRVRAVDRGSLEGGVLETDEDGNDVAFKVGVVVRCTPRVRAKFNAARALARRVAGEALPIWACMEAVAAEALSALPFDTGLKREEIDFTGQSEVSWPDRMAGRAGDEAPRRQGHLLEAWTEAPIPTAANVCAAQGDARVARLLADLDSADAFELDARLRRAVALEQRLDAELAPLLAEVARFRLYLRQGFTSLEGFAREHLGLSPRKARALLRIERAAATCPALRAAFRSGRLSWVQVQTLLPVLSLCESTHSRTQWIERAEQVSVRRLEDDVDRALHLGEAPGSRFSDGQISDRQTCAQSRDAEANTRFEPRTEPEAARFFFAAPSDVARLFHAVACSVRRHVERVTGCLPSAGDAVEWMFDHAYEAWGANDHRVSREHRVFERDGWRCTVPGCSSYRNLHDHHIVFRAAGGSDELANRTTLCAWHHLRGVHAARIRCHGRAPHGLVRGGERRCEPSRHAIRRSAARIPPRRARDPRRGPLAGNARHRGSLHETGREPRGCAPGAPPPFRA